MGVLDDRLKKAQEKADKEISEKPYLNKIGRASCRERV